MELRDNTKSGMEQFYYQSQMELDTSLNSRLLNQELTSSCVQLEGRPDPHSNIWTDSEPARTKNSTGRSFAMDARIRLDSLKCGCNSPLTCCATKNTSNHFDSEKDVSIQSALDLVEILDIEDDMQDEESWLYEAPKKQFVEKESALTWCRHVLDNPSPEMEVARRVLMNKLNQTSRCHFYRHAALSCCAPSISVGSSVDQTSVSHSLSDSDTAGANRLSICRNSITTSYRLHDITDVHIMAKIQEASLREDYGSAPATASVGRNGETSPSHSDATGVCGYQLAAGTKSRASSLRWPAALSSLSSSRCQSPAPAAKLGLQSPRPSRLHQQVTQFKLLKRAQNQGADGRTRSPLRTSLRSLQAVRNSRSLEKDDCQPVGQFSHHLRGVTATRAGLTFGSLPPSPASPDPSRVSRLRTDSPVRLTAVKKLERSQSLSPCRIPNPAKGYLSANGRVFASPERPATAAWGRHMTYAQR
ncbi:unnamed protein product [Menidia menidia]|uniref:(Atlantic silverside) hypothetical protein n=1 Tax=Menidia menidia TaxID=238744 RepID=A0A8S4APD5_9TELE|nr:unnamed protein product [Menidia menidia]